MFRLTASLAIAVAVLVAPATDRADSLPAAGQATVDVAELEGDDLDAWVSALALFENQGMDLPPLEAVFSTTKTACNGELGLFQSSRQPLRVLICDERPFVLVHEMAHAWIHVNVTAAERARYITLHGLPTWNSHDISWSLRGVEHATRTIQTVLVNNGGPEGSPGWKSRREIFEMLVGRPYVKVGIA